ncbi:putative membrane protein [Bradyrhizobium sp. LB1.3]
MIANYTNHAANERTFLAWMAVAAFGLFMVKLNVLEAVSTESHVPADDSTLVAAAARSAGLVTVLNGIAIMARSGAAFERTRRAIDRDAVVHIPQSRVVPPLSVTLAVTVVIFCIYLTMQ